jgi:putative permease
MQKTSGSVRKKSGEQGCSAASVAQSLNSVASEGETFVIMNKQDAEITTPARNRSRAVWLAAGIFLLFWFAKQAIPILMAFFLSLILAIVINGPVTWMEKRGLSRGWGTLIASFWGLAALGLALVLVVPVVIEQGTALVAQVPNLIAGFEQRFARLLNHYPWIKERLLPPDGVNGKLLDAFPALLTGVFQYSLSVFSLVFFAVAIISMVIYMVLSPRALIQGYLWLLPPRHRDAGARALSRSCQMVFAWMKAHLIVGGIQAVLVFAFLSLLGIPGTAVWALLAFAAELVPKLGPYVMAAPPVLLALSIDPVKALWVAAFYAAMCELTGDTIGPWVRGKEMDIQPALLIFFMLVMGSAFGLVGALISAPLAGFLKAYLEEFYFSRYAADPRIKDQVEAVLNRRVCLREAKKPSPEKVA